MSLGVAVTPEIDMAAKIASSRGTQQPDNNIQCIFPHFRVPAILNEVLLEVPRRNSNIAVFKSEVVSFEAR